MRWDEEVMLLVEEMRRVRAFLAWHSDWWSQQEARRDCEDSFQEEGLKAYAYTVRGSVPEPPAPGANPNRTRGSGSGAGKWLFWPHPHLNQRFGNSDGKNNWLLLPY